jgi:hypothetical protein
MPGEEKQSARKFEPIGIVRFVSEHALRRWMERTEIGSRPKALTSLKKHLAKATEVELAPQFKAIALLNHDLKPARYLRFDTWVFVVSEQGGLLTIHSGAAKRWVPLGTKRQKRKAKKRRPH